MKRKGLGLTPKENKFEVTQRKNRFQVSNQKTSHGINAITALGTKRIPQTIGFHEITFVPSRGPKGSRLNAARKKFTRIPINAIVAAIIAISTLLAKSGTTKARTTKNKIASKIFTRGPAIEIIPFCLLFISPAI